MADATVRGRFVWHDLMTPNSAGAHEFYGKALGWKTEAWEQDRAYLMFAAPSGPIGGTVETRATTPHWLPYIGTADVDATVEAATRLGATRANAAHCATERRPLTPCSSIRKAPRSASMPRAPRLGPRRRRSRASSVGTSSRRASLRASRSRSTPRCSIGTRSASTTWARWACTSIFGRNGRQLGGMFDKGSAGKPGSAYWLGYVSVTDLEATVERAKAARGSVLTGPMDVPGGDRIAQLMDPHGAFFALHVPRPRRPHKLRRNPARRRSPQRSPPSPAKPAAAKPAARRNRRPRKPRTNAREAAAAKPKKAAKAAPRRKRRRVKQSKKRPAKKAAAKKKPAARKAAKKKSKAKKSPRARSPRRRKRKAKTRKRGR